LSKFSERYGYSKSRTAIQVKSIDDALRNGLWDIVSLKFNSLDPGRGRYGYVFTETPLYALGRSLNHNLFKLPMDLVPHVTEKFWRETRLWFMDSASWWEVYDFVEFVAQNVDGTANFTKACNLVMTREMAGYRFVDALISPIVDEVEISEIETALGKSQRPVAQHLAASLEFLSDRRNPNYRKSADEAILSVEAAARELCGDGKATLGQALKALRIDLHPVLKSVFDKLYGYTSDESGIRHALSDDGRELDQADARYMLISCSAFVNYLRVKAKKELP
jgi:hypothetical protein